ncbi:hypothetical protein M440DRAFT_1389172 [Trichoderma longibrachiatum ATCC 18648]|uniref:Uncharacterized protein n=1 Tax=Trichoderma longibrachiatum ATCC 18648 TaxID=983965 RepID=A0A2T4CC70_TRILO|nr:hypothetical protein M440DRAFT_1389172 [Trichoderma longibrachiatum ATCC 18648]
MFTTAVRKRSLYSFHSNDYGPYRLSVPLFSSDERSSPLVGDNRGTQRPPLKGLKILIDFVEAECAKFNEGLQLQLGSGLIYYIHLWAIFDRSTIVYSRTGDSLELPTASLVTYAGYKTPKGELGQHETPFYLVRSKTVYFDGNKLAFGNIGAKIEHFTGMVKISSLVCYPLEFHEHKGHLRAKLFERSKKILSLQGKGVHHKVFTAVAYRKFFDGKVNLQQDKIMIDGETSRSLCLLHGARDVAKEVHAQHEPNASSFHINGLSPRYLLGMLLSSAADRIGQSKDCELDRHSERAAQGDDSKLEGGNGNEGFCDECQRKTRQRRKEAKNMLTMIFHPTIAGDVKWDGQAWGYLMLEEHAKDLMRTSVIPHVSKPASDLQGTGPAGREALNILLHGPSDTGKTLTVEALCDHLQAPLMKISVDTFMVKPEIIGAALIHQKMLEVCHRWGAVLLIDDLPFLWSRMSLLAQQKQWPSVVLQHLTSPRGQGVIFFTCKGNHVNWGEGALSQSKVTAFPLAIIGCMRLTFGSFKTQEGMPKFRFNLSFRYTFPTRHGRMHLIRKCLARALERGQVHIAPLNDVGMRRLGDSGLNYRETRNVVQLALDWACEKGELMPLAVLQRLLDMPREHRSGPASVDGVQPSTPSPSLRDKARPRMRLRLLSLVRALRRELCFSSS